MPKSLFARLVLILLVLLTVMSAFYVALTIATARLHTQTVTQNLHRALAANLVAHEALLADDTVDKKALKSVFEMLMVVNPAIEVYLLDPTGKILAYSAPPSKIVLDRVALGPIDAFIDATQGLPIRGDDPRDVSNRKVFSVAAIEHSGRRHGYLYIILGGEAYHSIVDMLENNWVGQLAAAMIVASLILTLLLGALAFHWLTRRLRRLAAAIDAFRRDDFCRVPPGLAQDPGLVQDGVRSGDEIDRLTTAVAELAGRINEQLGDLEQSDQIRRELVTNISHDLKTPLTALRSALETLQLKADDLENADRVRYLDIALRSAEQLSRMITDLFELATLESRDQLLQFEPFSFTELVQDVTLKFHPMAERNRQRMEVELPAGAALVSGDIGLIERVLENLIENALKYTPPGGVVRMRLSPNPARVTAHIEDNGRGIPAAELPRVFDRSYRVAKDRGNQTEGAGLGLAIAKQILELHGARIDVRSEPGTGSSFSFSLPVASVP